MIHTGDCVEVMATLPESSVDAIVTDPPYDLVSVTKRFGGSGARNTPAMETEEGSVWARKARGFMGKTWDGTGVAFRPETWLEALRVAKPGAHLLAFGGTRTYHRLACAIEDAGWEIRDCLVWAYASGFPKSLNFADGFGTALKPAWEPIIMARKPLIGTVAANRERHGTGALNIDGTRIGTDGGTAGAGAFILHDGLNGPRAELVPGLGRWPANVILTDPIFDGGIAGVVGGGEATTGGNINGRPVTGYNKGWADERFFDGYGDSGTYSRFFLIPKADRADREPVLGGLPLVSGGAETMDPRVRDGSGVDRMPLRRNSHPTVKPTDLMRHLVRLVTPPGGTVLDPFLGSGTTGIAAEMEGFAWIGIEREAEYVAIAEARLNGTQRGLGLVG